MGWIGTVFLLIGSYLIGKKTRWGFALTFCGNIIWGVTGYRLDAYDLIATNVIFGCLAIWNFIQWSKKPE